MDKLEAGTGLGLESILEVRIKLVDSEPEIWRRFELRGSLALSQVHQVLQAAFGWEDAHLHRFVTSDPFAPLRPVDGEFPEVPQWIPQQETVAWFFTPAADPENNPLQAPLRAWAGHLKQSHCRISGSSQADLVRRLRNETLQHKFLRHLRRGTRLPQIPP